MEGGRSPLPASRVRESFPPRAAASATLISVEHSLFVEAGTRAPLVTTHVVPVVRPGRTGRHYEVVVEIDGVRAGGRATPPALPGTSLRRRAAPAGPDDALLDGFAPLHLGLDPLPRKTVEDGAFADTSYPWATVGLVETPRGRAGGVLIGPRHLLTATAAIDWEGAPRGFAASWARFTPASFDGDAPFGQAHGIHVYRYAADDDGDAPERPRGHAVVVLSTRIGERTGWMGVRGAGDHGAPEAWQHAAYSVRGDGARRPVLLDGAAGDAHHGPRFGWWKGDAGPRAVAMPDDDGADLAALVALARSEFA